MLIISLFRSQSPNLRPRYENIFSYEFITNKGVVEQWEQRQMCQNDKRGIGDFVPFTIQHNQKIPHSWGMIVDIYEDKNFQDGNAINIVIPKLYGAEELQDVDRGEQQALQIPLGASHVLSNHFQLINEQSLTEAWDPCTRFPVLFLTEHSALSERLTLSRNLTADSSTKLHVLDTIARILHIVDTIPCTSKHPRCHPFYGSDLYRAATHRSIQVPTEIWINIL